MKLQTFRRQAGAAAAVLALSVSLAACGSGDDEAGDEGTDTTSESADPAPAPEETEPAGEDPGAQTFGEGCKLIPPAGEDGSFAGMAEDPVGTAASTNPLLKTLVVAVTSVDGLVDTLNGAPELTVFAPYDGAFAEIPEADLNGLVEGAKADGMESPLAKVLTHHVLGANLDPAAVAGKQDTLAGDKLTIEGDESGMTVSDGTVTANVLCGNIPTANATVYVIDKVLTGVK